ncbi:5'-nucleotidase [Marinicellulosiphila megalodicopiae]|uniref:5'-nucleotidase n=1 Tax=Marinicellulosiphila megalodicopiae TaxID=2724896 RepID=UPI003BB15AF3
MAFDIEQKLVVGVASSALFDLTAPHDIFVNQGPKAYKQHQKDNINEVLQPGVAFSFIQRLLKINQHFSEQMPVEVVLLSRNSPATGERVFRSISHYGLDISRAAFIEGQSPFKYLPTFNVALFLSAHQQDVQNAIDAGFAAGLVLSGQGQDDESEELRIAFDFDGVIADDEAESVFKKGDLESFIQHESSRSHIPHNPGPLADFFKKIALIQKLEDAKQENDRSYQRILRTSIVTARNAPAHERMITTLENWGVSPNETFFLGGMNKNRVLQTLKPHIFFDDQLTHLQANEAEIPMVHIPFGIANA